MRELENWEANGLGGRSVPNTMYRNETKRRKLENSMGASVSRATIR